MENEPIISIIMPTYNRAALLHTAIDSVIKQTYSNWELLIIDDYSTDNTISVIKNYSKMDKRIKYISNKGIKGVSAARNTGILNSTGAYIAFLDSDDEWLEDHLNDSIKCLIKNNELVCFALWTVKDMNGNCIKSINYDIETNPLKNAIKETNATIKNDSIVFTAPSFFKYITINPLYCYHINTMVFKKDIIKNTGLFNENLLASEDIDFILRVLHNYNFCLILKQHYIYKQGNDNIYNFMNRKNINLSDLVNNENLVNKLNLCGIYKCKAIINKKNLIKKSTKIKYKKKYINACNKKLSKKYFSLGYINKNLFISKSVYFFIKSLIYNYNKLTIELIINTIFPFIFKKKSIINKNDLSL